MTDTEDKPMEEKDKKIKPVFSPDRPIESYDEDELGRDYFAKKLAKAIIGWQGDDSLVIGLFGDWGSGKSSVKKLIQLSLEEVGIKPIEFNPWMWSGQDRLMTAFFEEVGTALGEVNPETQKKWKEYSKYLNIGSTALGHLKTLSDVAGIPWLGLLLGGLKSAAKGAGEVTGQLADVTGAESGNSIIKLKHELADALKCLEKPLVVILDDIDRLQKSEIPLLFQLIKINADFPKVVFLVLCDRRYVEKALDDVAPGRPRDDLEKSVDVTPVRGRNYLEKIIQVSFDLPSIDDAKLDDIFDGQLHKVLCTDEAQRRFNEERERWEKIYPDAIKPFFKNIRDIRRFMSSFSFIVGLYIQEDTLDINLVDLIGIEIIRLFEPELYRQIPNYQSILAPDLYESTFEEDYKEKNIKLAEDLVKSITDKNTIACKQLLVELFPNLDSLLGMSEKFPRTKYQIKQGLTIADYEFFDRYFRLRIPEGAISRTVFEEIVGNAGDREWVVSKFHELHEQELLEKVIRDLQYRVDIINPSDYLSFVTALFDVSDDLQEDQVGRIELDYEHLVPPLIRMSMDKVSPRKERGQIIISAIESTTGLLMPVQLVAAEKRLKNRGREKYDGVLDDDQLEVAVNYCVKMIEKRAEKNELPMGQLGFILWAWGTLAEQSAPRTYVNRLVSSPTGAVSFLLASLNNDPDSEGNYFISVSQIHQYTNEISIEQVLSSVSEDEVVKDSKNPELAQTAIREFHNAIERMEQGEPDDLLKAYDEKKLKWGKG